MVALQKEEKMKIGNTEKRKETTKTAPIDKRRLE